MSISRECKRCHKKIEEGELYSIIETSSDWFEDYGREVWCDECCKKEVRRVRKNEKERERKAKIKKSKVKKSRVKNKTELSRLMEWAKKVCLTIESDFDISDVSMKRYWIVRRGRFEYKNSSIILALRAAKKQLNQQLKEAEKLVKKIFAEKEK